MDSHSYRFLCFQSSQSLAKFTSQNIINLNLPTELCLLLLYINSCYDMVVDLFFVVSRPGKNTQVFSFHSLHCFAYSSLWIY